MSETGMFFTTADDASEDKLGNDSRVVVVVGMQPTRQVTKIKQNNACFTSFSFLRQSVYIYKIG
jgi:hypothetical protein